MRNESIPFDLGILISAATLSPICIIFSGGMPSSSSTTSNNPPSFLRTPYVLETNNLS